VGFRGAENGELLCRESVAVTTVRFIVLDYVPVTARMRKDGDVYDAGAVTGQDSRRAAVVLRKNIGVVAAVEISRLGDMPGGSRIGQGRSTAEVGAVYDPDRRRPVVVLPQDVGLAVAVEISSRFDTRLSRAAPPLMLVPSMVPTATRLADSMPTTPTAPSPFKS